MEQIIFEETIQEYGRDGGRIYIPKKLRKSLGIDKEKYLQTTVVSRHKKGGGTALGLRFYSDYISDIEFEDPCLYYSEFSFNFLQINILPKSDSKKVRNGDIAKLDRTGRIMLRKVLLSACELKLFKLAILFRRHNGFELWSQKNWRRLAFHGLCVEYVKQKGTTHIRKVGEHDAIVEPKDIRFIKKERLQIPTDNFFLIQLFPGCFLIRLDKKGEYKNALSKSWDNIVTLIFEPIYIPPGIDIDIVSEDEIRVSFYHLVRSDTYYVLTGKKIFGVFKKVMSSFYVLEEISEERVQRRPLIVDCSEYEKISLWTGVEKMKEAVDKWRKE